MLGSRRLARLREEVIDEAVPLPVDGPAGGVLLEELLHARQPPLHEGRAPRYGALVFTPEEAPAGLAGFEAWASEAATLVDLADLPRADARRFADGRGSFLVVGTEQPRALACFADSVEYEASLVDLQRRSGAIVIQRRHNGHVRVATDAGLVGWDGLRWTFKPTALRYEAPIRRLAPAADPQVLGAILEFCVHWLSAGRVGATLVWFLETPAPFPPPALDATPAPRGIPGLNVTRREHFPALLSALSQLDRAAVVLPDGGLWRLGVELAPSRRADEVIAPVGGTRHTSARRFSFDEPSALVFVVSEDGPVSVFSDGASAASVRTDPCRSGFAPELLDAAPDPAGERRIACPRCGRCLLVDVVEFDGWAGGPERLPCPVCRETIELEVYRAALRGVVKEPGPQGTTTSAPRRDPVP